MKPISVSIVSSIRQTPAARRPVAVTAAAKPAAKQAPVVAKQREFVARVEPKDTLWYRVKRAVADVLCNIDLPKIFATRTLSDDVPKDLIKELQPGDVLLRRTEGTSGNYFIPSWWKHAAVYVGNGKIVEATFAGVKTTTLKEFFAHGDHAAVVRAKELSESDRRDMAKYARRQEGKPYDFDADFDDDSRLMCTELAYQALKAASGGKEVATQNWFGAVVGDAFLTDKFEVIYTSAPDRTPAKK